MFDIGWGELLLIGAVALVVIGPKDLPGTLRTVGNAVAKLKRMAGEFQAQFNEAMREAELDDIKKSVSEAKSSLDQGFNPIQSIRDELKSSIETKPETNVASSADTSVPLPPAPEASVHTDPAPVDPTPFDVPPIPDIAPVAIESVAVGPAPLPEQSGSVATDHSVKPKRKRKSTAGAATKPGEGTPA